jgi:hypothetical protein
MSVMSSLEFLLWAALGFIFWKKSLHRRFPSMSAYLVLRLFSMPILLALLIGQSKHWFNNYCFVLYFFAYWAVYLASTVMLYFVTMELFRSALSSFGGLIRFGAVIFRWAAIVSVIVSVTSITYTHKGIMIIPDLALGLMRSVSILELCLLAFLCLSMNALRLSTRDMSFGIALGFGLMSANDFVIGTWLAHSASLISPLQFVNESLVLVTLLIWVTYCAVPEPVRKPVVVAANSTIYRWNEIASALGHPATQVAVPQPANSFFLTDVEKVVEKVLTRNLRGNESQS